ncbi:TlpA disulfide reductase family protein [Pontibacter sp. G13]|uniref:TlpA disulfide reductase family protein n=1 Tax=Pontibacter sp. G13 TaxID=3074898 RepID=UPI002889010D|nr:TlpA disulfide reductase family protein [Pontibacter sp. G13]WNJ16677.1 TlpA disulfide reductase family protein [Pontibacter sp. G13]
MRNSFYLLMAVLMLAGCQSSAPETKLETGHWRLAMELAPGVELPVDLELTSQAEGYQAAFINGEERIEADQVRLVGDSIYIDMSVFDAQFAGKIIRPGEIAGDWINFVKSADYRIPFVALAGDHPRFPAESSPESVELSDRYAVTFSPENPEDSYPAIGVFQRNGQIVQGTFLTETGDYRYLAGVLDGDELKLSCFDGAHAFLFEAQVQPDGSLTGSFRSGSHWEEPWEGHPDPDVALREPDQLTFLKEGYEGVDFRFTNLEGDTISLSDSRYQGKVVIVQILGSWCPNCMDETRLFAKWYDRYEQQGLEIVGLAFERAKDQAQAVKRVSKMKEALGVNYEILIASLTTNKQEAARALPMLNHILSYPTSIYLDREGRVRKIHTGFYGPGTGAPYDQFVEEYSRFLEKLLAEGDLSQMAAN